MPTDAEWTILTDYLGGGSKASGKLKEVGTAWISQKTNATNMSLFTGVPAGGCSGYGGCGLVGKVGFWWCSNVVDTISSYSFFLFDSLAYNSINLKLDRLSIRCLKD